MAYLNKDFSVYRASLQARFSDSVRTKFGTGVADRASLRLHAHEPLAELRNLVDPQGWNLAFRDAKMLLQRANEWLAPSHRAGICAIDDHDKQLFDAAVAIRNYIAHGSDNAHQVMNERLHTVDTGGPNAGLGRLKHQVNDVAKFLKKQVWERDGERVGILYLKRLAAISAKL